ncbi:unnamed protein product [Mytilus edulis]|uniref:DNA2/NAM7 helicase-like C-terminal domain-containing protein n=1 Tax=Mytilus edulis TaxID=6550 RepID=A0A8S3QPJ6_MYTED|nr:unnamed protein product [Mytilus edulis]
MVKNDLSYHCLQQQHRMRPEISELVRHIYDVLIDNENVYEYPPIKGVRKSLFFITHNQKEVFKDEGRSYSNEHEAEYLKELCLYLLKQGYKPSEITIIAAYTGQMFCLKEKMPRSKFEGVNICVLDNYQGEENEIILLSLVRSNARGDIGFLNRENRICVALSRAKQGLFIIGNSSTLTTRSKHWQTIIRKLQIEDDINNENDTFHKYTSFGKAIPLYCQNHPKNKGILAELPTTSGKVQVIEKRSSCDHVIERQCFDTSYEIRVKCSVIVTMNRTSCGHEYQKQCHDQLYEMVHRCNDIVTEQWLSCDHSYRRHCYDSNYVQNNTCQVIIPDERVKCGHEYERKCSDTNYHNEHKCSAS